MITPILTEAQARLIEDALVRYSICYSEKLDECTDAFRVVINARQDSKIKQMIAENSEAGSNWLESEAV